jgi:hypothetical protein
MLLSISALGNPTSGASMEQAVIVHFQYGSTDLSRLFALGDKLGRAIKNANAGEYDGNEVATDGSDGFLYMYGPSADQIYRVIEPILTSTDFMHGAEVVRRYGPASSSAREVSTTIGIGPKQ